MVNYKILFSLHPGLARKQIDVNILFYFHYVCIPLKIRNTLYDTKGIPCSGYKK